MLRLIKPEVSERKENSDERNLILAAQQKDTSAFRELYERYKDRIHSVIYYSLHDAHQSEDVLQTVFVKVFQSLPQFRFESGFATWLFTIALNECKNRNRRRRLFVSFSQLAGNWDHPDSAPRADEVIAFKERTSMVHTALMELKSDLRQVIVLKYLEELSYEEIASVLGCSTGTVASRLHRALQALEARLRP